MTESAVRKIFRLGFPWGTLDPFLFCVHHDDAYPSGNDKLGPNASLAGRNIGMDFEGIDGWRMYHGDVVPGFPRHPHRGFETITVARRGFIDHSDSMGATARFGRGDAQWMTAGGGVVHSEMFPLLDRKGPNHAELFQIWLNLPRANKMVPAHFSMLWADTIPTAHFTDDEGRAIEVTMVAGALDGKHPPAPPPDSWASHPEACVAVWTIRLAAGAHWLLPKAAHGLNRALYLVSGESVRLGDGGDVLSAGHGAVVQSDIGLALRNEGSPCELLMLQGRPIGEPVVQHGPFVMNAPEEINQTIRDFRATEFGGWPWKSDGPVHARDAGRFAIHADGRRETPSGAGKTSTEADEISTARGDSN